MRISELAKRSETSISTIKYYIREGLLPPGTTTAPNQSRYGDGHLERLDLIWRLKTFGGLPIDTIGAVLGAADGERDDYKAMGAGLKAAGKNTLAPVLMSDAGGAAHLGKPTPGQQMVAGMVESNSWSFLSEDPILEEIAVTLDRIIDGWPFKLPDEMLENYARLAFEMVQFEIPDDWQEGLDESGILKFALLGTFLFEPLILSVRRLAHRVRILESMK